MRLTVVGSGDAFNAAGRLHSCYLLEGSGFTPTMIDFGATALAGLHRLGRRATEVATFAFTHLHGDHLGGVPFLFIDAMYADVRNAPLRMVGPRGLGARARALVEVTYGELLARPEAPELEVEEVAPGQRLSVSGLVLETFPADHQDPPEEPLCLRFTGPDGASVAFSGDTRLSEGLLAAADGVDLLVAECSALAPPAGRHCTWEDWRRALPTLSARRVLLTHLGQDVRPEIPRLVAEAEAAFTGPSGRREAGSGRLTGAPGPRLDFADDGLVLEILPKVAAPA